MRPISVPFDQAAAIDRVLRLIRIPGGSRDETAILVAIAQEALAAGVPATAIQYDTAQTRIPGGGAVGNLIIRLPGTVSAPRRLLMAHVDTVPICVGTDPVIEGDVIRSRNPATGLGGDDRGGAAVVLTTLVEILRQRLPHPPLTFFFAVQEEIGLYGARYVSVDQLGSPEACFNWDGGDPAEACIGATGDYALDVTIHGIASHAGVHPELGVSAIAIASRAIADLTEQGWHGLVAKGKHRGSSNVGIIHGGDATNVVTPLLTLRAEARSHDPVFRKRIVAAYEKAFTAAAKALKSQDGRRGRVEFSAELKYESFRLPAESAVVRQALAAIQASGLTAGLRVGNGGLDANWMVAHGLPTVTLGCGQADIHTVNESLHLPSYLKACEIGLRLALGTE